MKSAELWQQYWATPTEDALRVYADALEQEADPRGRYLQLCLAGKRDEAATWQRKYGGKLVGDAKQFLLSWDFAPNGTVSSGRTILPKLVAGIDRIAQLDPFLILEVRSINNVASAKQLGALSPRTVGRIYMLDIVCAVTDSALVAMAPARAELRHLGLVVRGPPSKCFSPKGLAAFGARMKQLRYLAIEYTQYGGQPITAYARAIADSFPALEVLACAKINARDLAPRELKLISDHDARATKIFTLLG